MADDRKDEELMQFLDEAPASKAALHKSGGNSVWRILITDDEKDVHTATTFALRNTRILGRPIEFLHANSARETIEILKSQKDIAVIMLDVVMETPNAGLDLVAVIREELKVTDSRIILRTGQPNQAPEIEVIRDYDINDYKLKSELTQSKLYAALTTAVRSYKQIRMIEAGKKSLDLIVRSSAELMSKSGLNAFAQGVIVHLSGLLSVPPEGLICVRRTDCRNEGQPEIIAAAGQYCALIDKPLSDLSEETPRSLITRCLDSRENVFEASGLALYLGSSARGDMSCFVSSDTQVDEVDQALLELFCTNISISADNLALVEQLRSYAYVDEQVGLPNRNALIQAIDEEIAQGRRDKSVLALVNIDNFAEMNASLSQRYGDQLLKAVGDHLRSSFSPPTMLARIGGDTFAIFGHESVVGAESVAAAFNTAFTVEGDAQLISVTSGCVPLREAEGNAISVIKDANIVLKAAKVSNRGGVLQFDRYSLEQAKGRLELLKNLRAAFDQEQLFLMYQPKIDIQTGNTIGVEALVRWPLPNGDLVSPGVFIPLAEQSGLIIRLGEWILRTALTELRSLNENGWPRLEMGVNLSVAQLQHPALIDMLKAVLSDTGVDPSSVDLEITESIAMRDMERKSQLISEIKALGFKVSVDDFGTGFSSLNYLQKMPVDCLKIDQTFVHAVNEGNGRDIVELIVTLGRKLNMRVIAEGVETEAQANTVSELGCDEVQGYFFAHPMSREQLHDWLATRSH